MDGILPELGWRDKERLLKELRRCGNVRRKTWLLIVINLAGGRDVRRTAQTLAVHRATVYRVAERFRESGEAGLWDGRRRNGHRKLSEKYLAVLKDVVRCSPLNNEWSRPTWTRELLVATLFAKTKVQIHVATMSIALRRLGARRGRPKPVVRCPWPESRRKRRLAEMRRLLQRLPRDEVLVYEDEMDLHLNPKIGMDWMLRGQQKQVVTPGKNVKRYLAGAMDARTRKLLWVEGDRKTSGLFVRLLWKLVCHYRSATTIHVVLDNYTIHSTSLVQISLKTEEGKRIRLHFLPPYCPDHNPIERVWQDLHANVTRNHCCATIEQLMENVHQYLALQNRATLRPALAA